jgi:uncharacterized membrane protein YdjX (TVP38/TMEM64 family)
MSHKPGLPDGALNRHALRVKLPMLIGVILILLGLAMAWSWSPLRHWLDLDRLVALVRQLGTAFGPVAATFFFALALTLAVPLTILTLVVIVAFGPITGFLCSVLGALAAAVLSYGLGAALGRDVVRRLAGARVNALSQRLAQRGLLAVIAVRMVPVAPFAIVNMIAGASHIRLQDLLLGTLLGMTPGTLAMAVFVDQIIEAMKRPSQTRLALLLGSLALIGVGLWYARRWARRASDT